MMLEEQERHGSGTTDAVACAARLMPISAARSASRSGNRTAACGPVWLRGAAGAC